MKGLQNSALIVEMKFKKHLLVAVYIVVFCSATLLASNNSNVATSAAISAINYYQRSISPILTFVKCRYVISCSEYAKQVIAEYGLLHGGHLTIKRLAKCV